MKRAPSEDLFRLVKSLNKAEKRNFKLIAGMLASDRDKKYIELFDVIDRQEVYDEEKIAKQVKNLYGGQLAVGKHYLYRQILRSLVYFRSSPSSEMVSLLDQARVLSEKELYTQALKLLRKGLHEVAFIEDFSTHYAMLGLESHIMWRIGNERKLADQLAEIAERRTAILEKMANLDQYRSLFFAYEQCFRNPREAGFAQRLASLKVHPLLTDRSNAKSVRADMYYLLLHGYIHFMERDHRQAYEVWSELLAKYEVWPLIKSDHVHEYFMVLNKVCVSLLAMGEVDLAFAKMDEFRQYRNDFPKSRMEFFRWFYVLYLGAGIQVGSPERVDLVEEELKTEWPDLENKLPRGIELAFRYMMAYSHFMMNRPKAALKWIVQEMGEPKHEEKITLQLAMRLLFLMVHFELGNYDLVENGVNHTRRFWEKHGCLHEFERMVLRCMRSMYNAVGSDREEETTRSWAEKLRAAESSDVNGISMAVDVATWLESRIQNCDMAALRRQQIQSANAFDSRLVEVT